jgi:hypothetical protein
MPGSTSSALLPILRQLRLVRRRWNTRELVRAALLLAATSGVVGALLILAALGTAPRRFLPAATLLGAAWLASAVGIALATRRRWLRRRTAHRQVDRHARLAGRLTAIVDLGAREESALRPLLAAESAVILPLWDARRLVPRRAPAGALAAAIVSGLSLALAVVLGPVLLPPPGPTLIVRDTDTARLPMRPSQRGTLARGGAVAETPAHGATQEDDDSLLAGMAEELQHRLHRDLWGEEEAIRAEELARAEDPERPPDGARTESERKGDEGGGESTGRIEPGGESREPEASGTEVAEGGSPEPGSTEADAGERRAGGTADGAARGAGTATSPDLYGAPTGGVHRAAAPFTLGLTANVHMTGGAARPPTGDTPLQMPDANPALVESPRDAVGLPRAPVPPEYAAVVRRLFEREP